MPRCARDQLKQMEATCGALLDELQVIWDDVGESDADRDRLFIELEKECAEVYRRKVDQANYDRAQLLQLIADSEAELAVICSTLGERPVHIRQPYQSARSLKEELDALSPQLVEMRKRKSERLNQFKEIIDQAVQIASELGSCEYNEAKLDGSDLSTKKLEDLYKQLESLQKEKSERLEQVISHLCVLKSICAVLGFNFKQTIREIDPCLEEETKNLSDVGIAKLVSSIQRLREIKIERMQKLQDLTTMMFELWNLMDTPAEEQEPFQNVTCNIAASEDEITATDALLLDKISFVEVEVLRLEQLKISKMKELVLKKKAELEELHRRSHMINDASTEDLYAIAVIESGATDASILLEQIEAQISVVKEEAFSRKDILENVEKWKTACEEEAWLEDYNRDENRYNAGRGVHLTLKRAEKARALVNKIPGIVETLASKITKWENEQCSEFIYDGIRLLFMLDNYSLVKKAKEQERKRQRYQKRLQDQFIAEQEAIYGSKPSPLKTHSVKKVPRTSLGGPSRRLSLGPAVQHPKPDILSSTKSFQTTKKDDDMAPRGLDIASLPVKKLSYNSTPSTQGVDTQRNPFAPLVPENNIPSTPSKPIDSIKLEEYNITKTVPIEVANTPVKLTAMQMALTPAPAPCFDYDRAAPVVEVSEQSFEERRLALYLSEPTRIVHNIEYFR